MSAVRLDNKLNLKHNTLAATERLTDSQEASGITDHFFGLYSNVHSRLFQDEDKSLFSVQQQGPVLH